MKTMILSIALLLVVDGFGQEALFTLLNRRRAAATAVAASDTHEQLFHERYPSGTNEFNRTFEEQSEYEKNFDLNNFLGFEFGAQYEGEKDVKLAKPFRGMEDVRLELTVKGRVAKVEVSRKTADISNASLSNEVDKIVSLLSRQYKIYFYNVHCDRCYCENLFSNEHIWLCVGKQYDAQRGTGRIWVTVGKESLFKDDKDALAQEKAREIEMKNNELDIPADEGAELLSSPVSLVRSEETSDVGAGLLGKPTGSFGSLRERRAAKEKERNEREERQRTDEEAFETNINAFLEEYLGCQFGDPIEKFPTNENDFAFMKRLSFRTWKTVKPYSFLDQVCGEFTHGKLTGVTVFADVDKKYSRASVDEKLKLCCGSLQNGYEGSDYRFRTSMLEPLSSTRGARRTLSGNPCLSANIPDGFNRYYIEIKNVKLGKEFLEAARKREQEEEMREYEAGEKFE